MLSSESTNIKDKIVIIDGKNVFDPASKKMILENITFERSQLVKKTITQVFVLLDYLFFKDYYNMTAIDLSK